MAAVENLRIDNVGLNARMQCEHDGVVSLWISIEPYEDMELRFEEHEFRLFKSMVDRIEETLVYTQSDLEEANFYDDEEMHDSVMLSMERNMHERGLCIDCGRPDLSGVSADDIMSEEEAKDLHDMWAEQAAERRAGC